MKNRIVMMVAEVGIAALLMWFDIRVFWLYFFGVLIWNLSRILAVITANHLEMRVHLEIIQNRVGVVPGVDADNLVQQMRENMSEEEWKQLSEMFKFARRS